MLETIEVEVDNLTSKLADAIVCVSMADIIKETDPDNYTLKEDVDYYRELLKSAEFILQHYTTPEEYMEYMTIELEPLEEDNE